MCSISFLLLFLFSFTASYCIKRFFFQCNILIPLIIFSLCFLSYFFSGSSSTEHIHLNLESTSDLCCLNFNVVWKCGSYISYFLLPFCTVAVIIVLLLLYILHLHVLQTQQYSVIIITPHNCMSVEESENKGRQAYVYRFFYINFLLSHFWFSSLVFMDQSYCLVSFPYSNTALLFPYLLCVIIVKYITFLYIIGTMQFNTFLYNCFLSQLKDKRRSKAFILFLFLFFF